MNAILKHHKITSADFHKMAEVGILAENSRVELIDGEMIDIAPIGSRHADTLNRLNRLLIKQLDDAFIVAPQNPVRLADFSEPEPDIAILKPRLLPYSDALPTAEDVLLIIEIADTSLAYDRDIKIPLYAKHGIPEVWLIDLNAQVLTKFTLLVKDENRYATATEFAGFGTVRQTYEPYFTLELSRLFQEATHGK